MRNEWIWTADDAAKYPLAVGVAQRAASRRRKPRPSPLIARAAAQGLQCWQVSVGLPSRLPELARLEAYFAAHRVLITEHVERGRWRLALRADPSDLRQSTLISAKLTLQLLDAADGSPEAVLPALRWQQQTNAPESFARAMATQLGNPLWACRLANFGHWAGEFKVPWHRMGISAVKCLARQPEDLRWALLHQRTRQISGLRDLNWEAFSHARSSAPARRSYLPPAVVWQHATGALPPANLDLPPLHGFKFGTLRRICAEFADDGANLADPQKTTVHGWLPAVINLVRLFGDYNAIRRFVTATQPWHLRGVHDAGQFRMPAATARWSTARWSALCLRHPGAVRYARYFPALEAKGHNPNCLSQLQELVLRQDYPKVAKQWEPLAAACLRAKLDAGEFQTHQSFWSSVKLKPADFMPPARVRGEDCGWPGWQLTKLATTDYRGPLLGALTGCCQHLGGAGAACAQHGVTSPFSAFYVIERRGQVVAQSWAWRNVSGGVVFDSVEALDRSKEVCDATAALLAAAKPQLLAGSLGITGLFLGDTGSGITREVCSRLGYAGRAQNTAPADRCDYYDGEQHLLWAGTKGRKQKLPAIEGYRAQPGTPGRREYDEYRLTLDEVMAVQPPELRDDLLHNWYRHDRFWMLEAA